MPVVEAQQCFAMSVGVVREVIVDNIQPWLIGVQLSNELTQPDGAGDIMITLGTNEDDFLVLLQHHPHSLVHNRHRYIDDTAVPTVIIEDMGGSGGDLEQSVPMQEVTEITK